MTDRGSAAAELAILTPVFLLFLLLAVFATRVAQAEGEVSHAAWEAARAASLAATPATAETAADETAAANIAAGTLSCLTLSVSTDTTGFTVGGRVVVTVTCETSFADLSLLPVPGTRPFAATGVEVVDTYRGEGGS